MIKKDFMKLATASLCVASSVGCQSNLIKKETNGLTNPNV